MAKKKEINGAKAKAIAEFEGDDSLLTLAERYLYLARAEVLQLDVTATEKKKITGHLSAVWYKLMELKSGVEDKIDNILLRFDDSRYDTEEYVRSDCRELYDLVESYRANTGWGVLDTKNDLRNTIQRL